MTPRAPSGWGTMNRVIVYSPTPSGRLRRPAPAPCLLSVLIALTIAANFCGCRSSAQRSIPKGATSALVTATSDPTSSSKSTAAPAGTTYDPVSLHQAIKLVQPLHQKLGWPKAGDWLTEHEEPGQSFSEYLRYDPVRPTGKRNVLYVQPLGDMTRTERKIVNLTADYMGRFFNLPVKVQPQLPSSVIPKRARRVHPSWGVKQILTSYVLYEVLKPRLPDDAAAFIALTATDLWPGKGWNFVFGQASIRERVGVWSLNRNGNPDVSDASFRLALVRTLKTAVHETGHMFSMLHCTAYECCMCGVNHREESDRRPLWLCPECMAKVCWATKISPVDRYRRLAEFAKAHGLKAEHQFFVDSLQALRAPLLPTDND